MAEGSRVFTGTAVFVGAGGGGCVTVGEGEGVGLATAVAVCVGFNVGVMIVCVVVATAVAKFAASVLITVASGCKVASIPTSNWPQPANSITITRKPACLNPSTFTIKFTRYRLYP